jgi:hypothetical protein
MYLPVALTPGMWGVDTSAKLTAALLDELLATDLHAVFPAAPKGTFASFVGRYGPLPGNSAAEDIDPQERLLIATRKVILILFQHVRGGSWLATGPQGAADAAYVATYAKAAGYAPVDGYPTPSIFKDMESVANPGPQALECMQQFMQTMQGLGFQPPGYNGFDCGITPDQWAALNTPVMCDAGDRKPPTGKAFVIKQHAQVKIGGVYFDVDEVLPNPELAGVVYGMAEVDVEQAPPTDPNPHLDPSGPAA